MSYTQQNICLVKDIEFASEEEFKQLSARFFSENSRLMHLIASDLFSTRKNNVGIGYEDVVANVQIATLEVLKADPSNYLSRGVFWKIVKNRAKERLHNEIATGVNYQTFKRLIRDDKNDLCDVILEDDVVAARHQTEVQKSLEDAYIDDEIRAEFDDIINSLSDIERKAITCRKYPEFDEPVSRRTYTRIRTKARNKILAKMKYDKEDYYSAYVQ